MKKKMTALLLAATLSCGTFLVSAADTVPAVQYRTSADTVTPGGTFDVTVSFHGIQNAVGYAVMLSDDGMTASGVTCTKISEIGGDKAAFFAPDPNDVNDVAAAYLAPTTLNGDAVRYTFTVPNSAKAGSVITLFFNDSVLDSNNLELTDSGLGEVSVTVVESQSGQLLGDINCDGVVEISDAVALFRHSMMPFLYPISYNGNMDFSKDGKLDISDAMALFRYSMLPGIYPLD